MINTEKLKDVIKSYKSYFPKHWEDEKYKWEAVKHFQDNWDIEAENFGTMFKKATDKTFNLLASGYAYPRGMILEFAKADDNAVREMFRRLFDESLDLSDRMTAFMNTAEELRNKYNDGTWNQHYQNTNYISTYLWLMYPDKYYIYKYELFKKCAEMLDDTYRPKGNGSVDNVIGGFKMYDEIRVILKKDAELRKMLDSSLTDSCYPDPEMITLTMDIGFYAGRFYGDEETDEECFPADEKYTKFNFLKEVFLTESEYDKLRSLVLRKKNIILQGAPGVGKTFSAKRLAYSIIGEKNDNRICMVQFHQNYSYEDFIMGYRPNDSGGFELQSGVFYNFCIRCKEKYDKPYFFIIDEINRGNLSKIFGELLMLIETDKRGEKHKLNLVYGGKPFYIPENLHIIGMMNTADRSLAMIDYALRRRFSFYTMHPAFDNADQNGFGAYTQDISCDLYHSVIAKIRDLNDTIRKDSTLGKGFEIGHSYFAPENKSEINDEWVRGVVEYEIIPLIEEYWFDGDKKVEEWTKALYQALGDRYDR